MVEVSPPAAVMVVLDLGDPGRCVGPVVELGDAGGLDGV
jgi:hypothetical protein